MAHLDEGGFLDIELTLNEFPTDFGRAGSSGEYLSRNNGSQFNVPENLTLSLVVIFS
jgi:hypothetical protein